MSTCTSQSLFKNRLQTVQPQLPLAMEANNNHNNSSTQMQTTMHPLKATRISQVVPNHPLYQLVLEFEQVVSIMARLHKISSSQS
jgi:hypothetical protein